MSPATRSGSIRRAASGPAIWRSIAPGGAPGDAYFPFLRLALVRFQPDSIADRELSPVVIADFVQLAADRTVTVIADPDNDDIIDVAVMGPASAEPHGRTPLINPAEGRDRIEVTLEKRIPFTADDLGWMPVSLVAINQDELVAGAPDGLLWSGRITLPSPRAAGQHRLVIRGFEYFAADSETAGARRVAKRLVYADTIPLTGETTAPGSLAVSIRDEDGAALVGACLALTPRTGGLALVHCDRDDGAEDGELHFADLLPGLHRIAPAVTPDGYVPAASQEITIVEGERATATIAFDRVRVALGDLIIFVANQHGQPVGQTCFELDRDGQRFDRFCDQQDDGRLGILDIPAGEYVVRQVRTAPNHEQDGPHQVTVPVDDTVELNIINWRFSPTGPSGPTGPRPTTND